MRHVQHYIDEQGMNKWREEIMGNMYRENQIEKDRQRERER